MIKHLEAQIRRIIAGLDQDLLGLKERGILANLQQNFNDARIYARAYELSEVREEQEKNATEAKRWLAAVRKNILTASEYDIFGAVDVAHLSAQIEQISEGLK